MRSCIVHRSWLAFLAPFCIGLVGGLAYRRYPNRCGGVLSHAALGLISVAIGLV